MHSILTDMFLANLYCLMCLDFPVLFAFLYSKLRFLETLSTSLVSHGRLGLLGIVPMGMHSSITCKNLLSHLDNASFMSPVITESQSVRSNSSHALGKSALAYLQTFLACDNDELVLCVMLG